MLRRVVRDHSHVARRNSHLDVLANFQLERPVCVPLRPACLGLQADSTCIISLLRVGHGRIPSGEHAGVSLL